VKFFQISRFLRRYFTARLKISDIDSSALFGEVSTWMGDQILILRVVIIFFPLFPSFSKAISKTAELPSLCNIVSFFHQLFVPRFAMAIFMCIYLHYIYCSRIHNRTRRSNYPQFSGLLFLFRHSSMVKPV